MFKESREPHFCRLGQKEAEMYLAINNFPGQRTPNPLKIKSYADNMRSGTQRRLPIAIAKVKAANMDYLMNGQHNLLALKVFQKSHPAIITYYVCETMNDAWELFATFDIAGSRTDAQFMKSKREISDNENLKSVPLRVLACCGTALYSLGNGNGVTPVFPRERIFDKSVKGKAVSDNVDDVLFVSQFSDAKHMLSVGAITACIATHRKNPTEAQNFWTAVADGELLEKRDPEYKLRNALTEKQYIHKTRQTGAGRHAIEYSLCVAWWNTKRRGETRQSVKLASMKEIPKVLA